MKRLLACTLLVLCALATPARARGLRARWQRARVRVGQLGRRAGQRFAACARRVGRAIDRRLPAGARRQLHRAWRSRPVAVLRFIGRKLHQDAKFLAVVATCTTVASQVVTPALALTSGWLVATTWYLGLWAIDIGAIIGREHARRDDRHQSIVGTLRSLGAQFRRFEAKLLGTNVTKAAATPRARP